MPALFNAMLQDREIRILDPSEGFEATEYYHSYQSKLKEIASGTRSRIPYGKLHPYQQRMWNKMFFRDQKFCCQNDKGVKCLMIIWARRLGKDYFSWNTIIGAALARPGLYFYLYTSMNQVRRNMVHAMDGGVSWISDMLPRQLLAKKPHISENSCECTLINGSVIVIGSTFGPNKHRGSNALGIVFSEYQDHDPEAYGVFSPMLARNGGWVIFNGTPRGSYNEFYNRYCIIKEAMKEDPLHYYTEVLTVEDAYTHDGERVYSDEALAREKINMPYERFRQEYYCDFDCPQMGAIYGREVEELIKSGRAKENIPIKTDAKFYAAFDIGAKTSATTIVLIQLRGDEMQLVWCYETHDGSIVENSEKLIEFLEKNGVKVSKRNVTVFYPWDIEHTEAGTGRRRIDHIINMPFYIQKVNKTKSLWGDINKVRTMFKRFLIDETRCRRLLQVLKNYSKEYNEKIGKYDEKPKDDWTTHMADALRCFCAGWTAQHEEATHIKHEKRSKITTTTY